MAEFTVIETQEQLNAIIGDRIRRAEETAAKRYEGWFSPEDVQKLTDDFNAKIKSFEDAAARTQQEMAEKDAKIAEGATYRTDLEKTRIALAAGLKVEYADRLRGETAEEWEADAEALAKDFRAAHIPAPLASNEPTITKPIDTAEKFATWMEEQMNN